MKTYNKIIIAFIFSLAGLMSYGQTAQNAQSGTGWIISKDVQKISNKYWLGTKSGLTIASVDYPDNVISKGIQKFGKPSVEKALKKGNVVSEGYPTWIISKDVYKIGKVN